eukprot:6920660-Pyramimonas_sp.AAC.1
MPLQPCLFGTSSARCELSVQGYCIWSRIRTIGLYCSLATITLCDRRTRHRPIRRWACSFSKREVGIE